MTRAIGEQHIFETRWPCRHCGQRLLNHTAAADVIVCLACGELESWEEAAKRLATNPPKIEVVKR